jgi:hypothetical protein
MGLDMYLNGEKFFYNRRDTGKHPKIGEIYEMAYWRKHPDLHGFIVETFADGIDDCKRIWLSDENIETIIKAVKDEEQRNEDVQLLEDALAWVRTKEDGVWRSLIYHASW